MIKSKKWAAGRLIPLVCVLLTLSVLAALLLPPFLRAENDTLETTSYEITNQKLPASFDGYRIVMLTDLHSKVFGNRNDVLIKSVEEAEPDIVLVCGDTLNSRDRSDFGAVFLDLCRVLSKSYPVYIVYGNHEQRRADLNNIERTYAKLVEAAGGQMLTGKKVALSRAGETINLYGLDLPYIYYIPLNRGALSLFTPEEERYFAEDVVQVLGEADSSQFNLLLTHNPKRFAAYADWGADLVLSGHEHGGIIRLPLIGGLATSPASTTDRTRYDAGLFERNGRQIIVGRGLGGAVIPYRIFNRPEVVAVTLRAAG